jgi:hypothetical protein
MIIRKSNKTDGEPLTLDGLMSELNNLFASRKDDPKAMDIRSMIQSLVNGEACFEEEDVPTQMNKHFEKNLTCDANTFVNAILGEEHDEKAEDDAMTACPDGLEPEGIDISNEDLSGGMIGYDCLYEAVNAKEKHTIKDMLGDWIPMVAFISTENMMEGVVDTIRAMKSPTIVAAETTDGGHRIITKAFVACGETRTNLLENGATLPALVFDEKSGMCRLSINRKDGYDFIFGENGVTRFIIFDELSCPATIPTDIVQDDRKWGKRMTSELPKLIEQRIEESKTEEKKLPFADAVTPALTKIDIPMLDKKTPLCNLPETCTFEETPYANIKKPLIADIMKDFADAKCSGKVGKDTFVEFMKPENKDAVASAVATSIAERHNPSEDVIEKDEVTKAVESAIFEEEEDDFSEEDTNPDCFRCIAEYMVKEGVDSVHFYTDVEGLIHCDVQLKTIYKVELEDSDKK